MLKLLAIALVCAGIVSGQYNPDLSFIDCPDEDNPGTLAEDTQFGLFETWIILTLPEFGVLNNSISCIKAITTQVIGKQAPYIVRGGRGSLFVDLYMPEFWAGNIQVYINNSTH